MSLSDLPASYTATIPNAISRLYDTALPKIDPEGLISKYVEFEFYRFKQDQNYTINGDLTERLKVLHWYIAGYGPHRMMPIPISNAQIRFLNSPMPMVGLGVEISIAAYSFIVNEYSDSINFKDPDNLREALFWWCTQRAHLIAPGGELVTQSQLRILTHTEGRDIDLPFALNWSVRKLHATDASLAGLDPQAALDRAILICILMLRSSERPVIASLLPRSAVTELLDFSKYREEPLFDRILAFALGPDGIPDVVQASELKALLVGRLQQHGLPMRTLSREAPSRQPGIGLPFVQNPKFSSGVEAGIAVIGPIRAASGLGQATRLSIDVLTQAGRDPAIVDFGLDNPAPTRFATPRSSNVLRTPRQINLLHLNAESIPLAFAYLDKRLLENSYNIGYFFWELDQIPKCHALALDLIDEIWVSSEYNREIYARSARVPVHNVGMAVEPLPEVSHVARSDFGLADDAFVFLATFDSFSFVERKNPLGVIRAFQAAFPFNGATRVALVLKTQNRTRVGDPHQIRIWQAIDDVASNDPRINIIDRTLSYADLLGFKRMCNAYVSLHRSEGWGFGIIEAMQLKLPVITTGYSGNMEFCSSETAFLVDYKLINPTPAEYIFVERGSHWADPCETSAATAMRAVIEAPTHASAKAEEAFLRVGNEFSLTAIARRYDARLTAIQTAVSTRADDTKPATSCT